MQIKPITRQMVQFYLEGLRIGVGKAYYKVSTIHHVSRKWGWACSTNRVLTQGRERQRGLENSGKGSTYHKTPPQKLFFGAAPPKVPSPPPRFGNALSCPLEEMGSDQSNPTFRGLQSIFEGALYSAFSTKIRGTQRGSAGGSNSFSLSS